MPSIVVALPAPFHRAAGGRSELAAEGETVAAALASLRERHPVAARRFLKESGEPRPGVSLFLDGVELGTLHGLDTALKDGDRLAVVLLVSGG